MTTLQLRLNKYFRPISYLHLAIILSGNLIVLYSFYKLLADFNYNYLGEIILIGTLFLCVSGLVVVLPSGSSWRPALPLLTITMFILPPALTPLVGLPGLAFNTARNNGTWWKYLETFAHVSLGLFIGSYFFHNLMLLSTAITKFNFLYIIFISLTIHLVINRFISCIIVANRENRSLLEQLNLTILEFHWVYLTSYLVTFMTIYMYLKGGWTFLILGGIIQIGIYKFNSYYATMQKWQQRALAIKRKDEEHIAFQANLLDQAFNGIFAVDLNERIIYWNKYAETLFQCKSQEALGQNLFNIFPDICTNLFSQVKEKAMNHGHCENEFSIVRKDGSTIYVFCAVSVLKDAHGEPNGLVGVTTDITERKKFEEEISRLDRFNLIGEMAASIGHEVRNPMTTVRGFLQLLDAKNNCSEQQEYFKLMIKELDRANSIITEYLSLAKDKSVKFSNYDINQLLNNLVILLEAEAILSDKTINLELTDVPEIYLDEKEISQLIINLVRNGLEAMDNGGKIKIKTYTKLDSIMVEIKDEGPGIPKHIIEKIGTPFITTKETGTGLGLAVCYSIAARNNAKIDFETTRSGTTFYITFKLKH